MFFFNTLRNNSHTLLCVCIVMEKLFAPQNCQLIFNIYHKINHFLKSWIDKVIIKVIVSLNINFTRFNPWSHLQLLGIFKLKKTFSES